MIALLWVYFDVAETNFEQKNKFRFSLGKLLPVGTSGY
jgi:hypothetical protein